MAVDETASPFLLASNEARVGTARWYGKVVIAADAIFIIESEEARAHDLFELFDFAADVVLPRRELPATNYIQIPESVRNHPAWPASSEASGCKVVIVPRNAVELLYHRRGKLEVRLMVSNVDVAIMHGRFGGGRIKAYLASAGWPLIWDNEEINLPHQSASLLRSKARVGMFKSPRLGQGLIASGLVIGSLPMLLQFVRNLDRDLVSVLTFVGWGLGAALVFFGWTALRRGL
jgi:hypothetical protein